MGFAAHNLEYATGLASQTPNDPPIAGAGSRPTPARRDHTAVSKHL
jgi:hypothetical protein